MRLSFSKWVPGGLCNVYQEKNKQTKTTTTTSTNFRGELTGEQPGTQNWEVSQLDPEVPVRTVTAKAVFGPEFFLVVTQI